MQMRKSAVTYHHPAVIIWAIHISDHHVKSTSGYSRQIFARPPTVLISGDSSGKPSSHQNLSKSTFSISDDCSRDDKK